MTNKQERWLLLVVGGGLELGLALAAGAGGWLLDAPPWQAMAWNAADIAVGVAAAAPMFLSLVALMRWPEHHAPSSAGHSLGPLRRIRQINVEVIGPLFGPCSLFELAWLSALAGIGEEWFFRGFVPTALGRWVGIGTAWIIASGVFGLLHALTPTYALLAALAGVYFACLWQITGNLLTPIVAHALYDWLALIYLSRRWGGLNTCQHTHSRE
jgi:membrane protease YdiL (CAAX protease family)